MISAQVFCVSVHVRRRYCRPNVCQEVALTRFRRIDKWITDLRISKMDNLDKESRGKD